MIGPLKLSYSVQIILLLAFLTLAFVLPHRASAADGENKAYWICKNRKQVRTIRVHINETSKYCSTLYSRDGEEKVIGSGKNHESCIGYLENIKTNLEKSNWTCRDITSTQITSTSE